MISVLIIPSERVTTMSCTHSALHRQPMSKSYPNITAMKGSQCCAGLMRSCLHTYRTKTNLTQYIIQPWGRHQASMGRGGHQPTMGGGPSAKYGGAISQVWGVISQVWGAISQVWGGGSSAKYGGAISQVWGGHQPTMGGPSAKYGGGYLFSHQYVQEVKIHRITLA